MSGRGRLAALIGVLSAILASCAFAGSLAPTASASPNNFMLGFADDRFADGLLFNDGPATRSMWAKRMADGGASLVRLNVYWASIVSSVQPTRPTPPIPLMTGKNSTERSRLRPKAASSPC